MPGGLRVAATRPATAAEWDAAAASPAATFYQTRWWAEAVAAAGLARPAPVRVELTDGTAAILPFSASRLTRGLRSRLVSSPLGTYGGWLTTDETDDARAAVLADAMLRPSRDLWWRADPLDPAMAGAMRGITQHEVTQAIDLQRLGDDTAASFSTHARRMLRRAEAAAIEVRRAVSDDDWDDYLAMYDETLLRWGEGPSVRYPEALFRALARSRRRGVVLWLATRDGVPAAGMLCVEWGVHVSYWHGASRRAGLESGANHRLVMEIVERARSDGRRWFDLNPSAGLPGVERFKAQFRPVELACPVVVRRSSGTAALQAAARHVGRLRSRRSAP